MTSAREGLCTCAVAQPRQLARVHEVGLVQDERMPVARSNGQRATHDLRRAVDEPELVDQRIQLLSPVTGDALERLAEPGRDLRDQRRLLSISGASE